MKGLKAFIIDDDHNILTILERILKEMGFECFTFEHGLEAVSKVSFIKPNIVLLDLSLPDTDGISVLRSLQHIDTSIPIILITAFGGIDSAIQAIHEGAYEYLCKPIDLQNLRSVINKALSAQNLAAHSQNNTGSDIILNDNNGIIGRHPSMVEVFKMIGSVTSNGNTSTVLILGETGVGKELVAQAIHNRSLAKKEPFITVQCAGVPESLIENELFGHERGAFTSANSRQIGRIEAAGSGIVFLDEIGDLPLTIQTKLLRLLEKREYERLGGYQTLFAQCRFVAATNKDLVEFVHQKKFREDLYYRLDVVTIRVPPLRSRPEDIPLLVNFFLDKLGKKLGRSLFLDPQALELLQHYDYPGNVRELAHIIEQAIALSRGPVLLAEHFPHINQKVSKMQTKASFPIVSSNLEEARKFVIDHFEKQFIEYTLNETSGNVTQASERSGVRRQHFQRLMQKHGISSETFRSQKIPDNN